MRTCEGHVNDTCTRIYVRYYFFNSCLVLANGIKCYVGVISLNKMPDLYLAIHWYKFYLKKNLKQQKTI